MWRADHCFVEDHPALSLYPLLTPPPSLRCEPLPQLYGWRPPLLSVRAFAFSIKLMLYCLRNDTKVTHLGVLPIIFNNSQRDNNASAVVTHLCGCAEVLAIIMHHCGFESSSGRLHSPHSTGKVRWCLRYSRVPSRVFVLLGCKEDSSRPVGL